MYVTTISVEKLLMPYAEVLDTIEGRLYMYEEASMRGCDVV